MRLTQKKIEEILVDILGKDGLPLIEQLFGKENVSEFDLATRTKKDIKIIRRMLYTLYNHNVVGFIRKKDKQKGWYIYYWTLLPENLKFAYTKKKKEMLLQLKQQEEAEGKELFFVCPRNCVRLNFDQATDFEFHCPECGELTTQDSGEEKVTAIRKQIREIEEELRGLLEEKKIGRIKAKERKKEVRAKKKVLKIKKGIKKAQKKKVGKGKK